MFNNEGFYAFSAQPTEDLGLEDADNEGSDDENPLAPVPGGDSEQPVSSSIDNEDDHTSDENMEESSEPDSDSELSNDEGDDEDVYFTANIYEGGGISIRKANFTALAKKLKIRIFPVPVQISNKGQKVITYLDRYSRYKSKNGSFGQGYIGHSGLLIKSLGLTKKCSFKMKYTGYSMHSLSNNRREKVYNLQIFEIGGIEESEPEAPDWATEAAKKPLLPAQMPRDAPIHWLINISTGHDPMRLSMEQYRIFMDQIGQPCERNVDVLIELQSEGCARYYTTFRGFLEIGTSYFRKGTRFCTISGFVAGDVIKMHYLGHRELSDGRKVYCLRAEKVRSAKKVSAGVKNKDRVKLPPRLARKRAQEALAKQFSSPRAQGAAQGAAPSPKRQQGPSLNTQATKVPKTIPKPRNTIQNIQKSSQWTTPRPAPTSAAAPASAVRQQQQVRQPQQRHQQHHGDGPSQPRQQVAAPSQQQEQPGNSIVDLVVKALLHRTDVDRTLVGKYLSLFARLPEITRDIDGSVILRLAAEPSVEALQTFLESAV